MKLYGYYRSSASYRIRIILNYKVIGWEYEPVRLNLGEQQSSKFRKQNPLGFVPVLDTGEISLTQSAAIAEFIEERAPEPKLLPADASGRAQVREMMGIIGCDIHPLQNLRILKYLRAEFGQDDAAVAAWCRRWISDGFYAYEKLTQQRSTDGNFSCGAAPTLADAWLIPQVYNARRFELDLASFPGIVAIDAHCNQLAAFASARPEQQLDAPQMQQAEE